MCDHSAEPGGREAAMVVIGPGVWCDPCIEPLVRALNEGGLPTMASCCGHGERPGKVVLADGQELFILPDFAAARRADDLLTGLLLHVCPDCGCAVEVHQPACHCLTRCPNYDPVPSDEMRWSPPLLPPGQADPR